MIITIWLWKWEDEKDVQIDTLESSVMPFLLWVALHKYFHSVRLLWIWLKNSGTRDAGYLGLSITWLSGRTSINDPAGWILNIVNRVNQNQNLGRLFCLLKRSRVLSVSSSACLWIPNQFKKSYHFSFPWGETEAHKSAGQLFQLPLNFEDLIWHLIFRAEDQDENPKERVIHPPTVPSLINRLRTVIYVTQSESVTETHIQIWRIIQNAARQTLLPSNIWNLGEGGRNNSTETKHWIGPLFSSHFNCRKGFCQLILPRKWIPTCYVKALMNSCSAESAVQRKQITSACKPSERQSCSNVTETTVYLIFWQITETCL